MLMDALMLTMPPWVYAVVITVIGKWGEQRMFSDNAGSTPGSSSSSWTSFLVMLIACYLFLAVLPASVLTLFGPLLPFAGAQAGLALAVVVIMFGLVPARLIDGHRTGWDRAFWFLFVDFVRVGGAFTLIGWLLSR